ncbi:MAG: NADH-quinone oxidoreductase subunit J [Acidobacteriota bacterium]|nr:NADH-quinone oxidoreductase subunit J [Blastocatellia bacterium]MDQ3221440.1 NADH-quinone oxidoreductase subunit J [Acidobacteriota bacterium]MDQ3490535.1 NADH-quinone oxidoreductase subunit J [Acidobacteriota bacterium]
MASTILFFLFAGFAIACAVSMVYQKNPLYSAISLVGVFISLSCIYIMLAAPFIAAVQILIYAGAIMVLVVFVIMLLNLDEDAPLNRLRYLYAVGGGLGLILLAQTFFIFYAVMKAPKQVVDQTETVGRTISIGSGMYTEYLLPVEIVGVLLLMAIIGGVILVRRLEPAQLELVVDNELEARNEGDEKDDYRIVF